jgi:uncharacterized protein (TIGR01732 family)
VEKHRRTYKRRKNRTGALPITLLFHIEIVHHKTRRDFLMSGVFGNNGFILLVVLFILLIIVGNSYPTAGGFGGYGV